LPRDSLGVGPIKHNPDSIGIDVVDSPACDVIGDAIVVLRSLPDSCVHSVYASHFVEHVDPLDALLLELVRVCVSGSRILFIAPHFSNPYFYSDPTHRNFFGLYTFAYYCSSNLFKRTLPQYVLVDGLVLDSVDFRFSSYCPNYIRHSLKFLFGYLVNLSYWTKELYEECFCWILPCYDVKYCIRVSKI